MIRRIPRSTASLFFVLLLAVAHGHAYAAEPSIVVGEPINETLLEDRSGHADVVTYEEVTTNDGSQKQADTHTVMAGFAGYRFLHLDSTGGRAIPYGFLHSSVTGGASIHRLGPDLKVGVDGNYINDNDNFGDILFDYAGDYRFHLRTETLYHNLDRLALFQPPFDFFGVTYTPRATDTFAGYGIRTEQDSATARFKLHNFPMHLNLGYWRLVREGDRQLIFSDVAFGGGNNTVYSRIRPVHQETHEGTFGFDAHLGPIDVIYTFLIRQFSDHGPVPLDLYSPRTDASTGAVTQLGGLEPHNVDPDSRYYAHTIKFHTSLSGGLVGAASYTYGKRSNMSRRSDLKASGQPSARLQNVAGDLTYIPCAWFTTVVKYRRQELANDTPTTISSSFLPAVVPVRAAIDETRDVIAVILSARPVRYLTVKGEYSGSYLHRENITQGSPSLSWDLPENSETHRGTVTLISRPAKGMMLRAQYGYTATDHPAYGTTAAEKHEGKIMATYNLTNRWGGTASLLSSRESNDQISRTTLSAFEPSLTYQLPRERSVDNATVGFWVAPLDRLVIALNYGILRSKTDQGVLFAAAVPGTQSPTTFTQQAQVYAVNAMFHATARLDLSILLQQVRSIASFDPGTTTVANAFVGVQSTSGVADLDRVKTVENTVAARADFRLSKRISCLVDYSFRQYDNKAGTSFEGNVQTVTTALTAKW